MTFIDLQDSVAEHYLDSDERLQAAATLLESNRDHPPVQIIVDMLKAVRRDLGT